MIYVIYHTDVTEEEVEAVIKGGGKLALHDALRCRVRYFCDGLVSGCR